MAYILTGSVHFENNSTLYKLHKKSKHNITDIWFFRKIHTAVFILSFHDIIDR